MDNIQYQTPAQAAGLHKKPKEGLSAYYEGITVTYVVWVFIIAGVLGFVLETLYWLVTTNAIESRQGLIYGPFSQIYGFGAVLLLLILAPIRRLGYIWVFIIGGVIGGLFEALCGIIQEIVFSSASWGYSYHKASFFGGRTSLKFMVMWGCLSIVFIKFFCPLCASIVRLLSGKSRRICTSVIVLALCFDMGLSALAVYRWSERLNGSPATNSVEIWLDKRYPDEKLKVIYPNMRFTHVTEGIDPNNDAAMNE